MQIFMCTFFVTICTSLIYFEKLLVLLEKMCSNRLANEYILLCLKYNHLRVNDEFCTKMIRLFAKNNNKKKCMSRIKHCCIKRQREISFYN